jgi:hypothetical protein
MLTEVRAAISAALTGQEYRIGNRWLTRANLKELMDMETHYEAKVARLSRGGPRIRGATPC